MSDHTRTRILFLLLLVPLGSLLVTGSVWAGCCPCELVANGGFEETPNGSRWLVERPTEDYDDTIEIQRNGIVLPSVEGVAHLELAAGAPNRIAQQVSTVSGARYEIRFAYHPRPGHDSEAAVLWNDQDVLLIPQPAAPVGWRYYAATVTGTGKDKLGFDDRSSADEGAAFIDDVSVCRVSDEGSPGCSSPGTSCQSCGSACVGRTATADY